MECDSSVIQEYASRLYRQSTLVMVLAVIIGIVPLGIIGITAGNTWGALIGIAVGGTIGFLVGDMIALALKLRA